MAATSLAGINRKPEDMETWELVNSYRHAHALAEIKPSAPLDKALSGWMFTVRRVLETRGLHDHSHLYSERSREVSGTDTQTLRDITYFMRELLSHASVLPSGLTAMLRDYESELSSIRGAARWKFPVEKLPVQLST
jgi:hypothetical protein